MPKRLLQGPVNLFSSRFDSASIERKAPLSFVFVRNFPAQSFVNYEFVPSYPIWYFACDRSWSRKSNVYRTIAGHSEQTPIFDQFSPHCSPWVRLQRTCKAHDAASTSSLCKSTFCDVILPTQKGRF